MGAPDCDGADGEVVIRAARQDDVPRLVELLSGGALRRKEAPARLDLYEAALADIHEDGRSAVLVAERGGDVVGVCHLIVFRHFQERGGLCAEIESVHVASDARSEGIGSVLVKAAVDRARSFGCYRVQLTSNVARADAHRFWARNGFEPTHVGFKRYLDDL